MGNQLSGTVPQQIHPLEYYLNELSNSELITFECNMGSTRFFKVAKIKLHSNKTHLINSLDKNVNNFFDNLSSSSFKLTNNNYNMNNSNNNNYEHESPGLGVAKIFVIIDPSLPLKSHKEKIERLREKLKDNPSCLTYGKLIINDKVAVLMRQYIKYNLYDKLSTRPFLNLFEKKWITFQILKCVDSLHKENEIHGDIKLENILITSSGWVLLTDFATYKPSYLPEDNPGEFSYFFDTSRRRTCNLAPERFVAENFFNEQMSKIFCQNMGSNLTICNLLNQNIINFVTPQMDLFSVGCVLAELFIEDSLFDLSALLSYKANNVSVSYKKDFLNKNNEVLNTDDKKELKEENKNINLSKNEYNKFRKINSIEIEEIKELIYNLIDLNPKNRKSCAFHLTNLTQKKVFPNYFFDLYKYFSELNNLSSDEKITKLNKDFDELSKIILKDNNDGFLIIINNVLACFRTLKHTYVKLTCLNLLIQIVKKIENNNLASNIILDRILPYIMNIISKDSCSQMKSHAITCLIELLNLVKVISIYDKNVFPDYILPFFYKTVTDEYAIVRTTLAKNLPCLSFIALRFLNSCSAISQNNAVDCVTKENMQIISLDKVIETSSEEINKEINENSTNSKNSNFSNYNNELKALQKSFQCISDGILTDKEISVRIELMLNPDLIKLCTFFGKQKTNEVIFSHLITFLNERIDFELRLAFYQCIIPIACYLGIQSSPLIKPLLQQGFTDAEETVINQSILTAGCLNQLQLMTKITSLELIADAISLIVHPNLNIRHSMIQLVKNCSQMLSLAELNCKLLPMVKPFLKKEQQKKLFYLSNTICDTSLLLDSLLDPIPRSIFDLILTKISDMYNLEFFFDILEKKKNLSKQYITDHHLINANNSEKLAMTPVGSFISLNSQNLLNCGTNKKLLNLNCSTSSNISINSTIINKKLPNALAKLFELLFDEGLNDEIKFKLIKMSNIIKLIFAQMMSTKSFITNSENLRNNLVTHKTNSALASNNLSFNKKVKIRFVHLSELNSGKYVPSNENEWHITSSLSMDSSNTESFTNYNSNIQEEHFEIAKEAKETFDDNQDLNNVKENLEDLNNDESYSKMETQKFCLKSNNKKQNFVSCPPCVSELGLLIKHKQEKFCEFVWNSLEFKKFDNMINENSNMISINSSATTIISNDGTNNNHTTNDSQILNNFNQNGRYAFSNYRPKGKLIANLTEHKKSISRLITIGNNKDLFISCSTDGTIKIWNTSKFNLGRNLVNRSKQTFTISNENNTDAISNKDSGNAFLGMSYSFGKDLLIAYTDTNDLYVIKVDSLSSKMPLYQKISKFCQNNSSHEASNKNYGLHSYISENASILNQKELNNSNYVITDISSNSPYVFICTFSNSNIKAFDLRSPLTKPIWTMFTNPNEGLTTCLAEGEYCIFVGTSYGHIVTFDTRFQLRSNTMNYNIQRRIRKLLYTSKGLYSAVQGYNEISLWDCESSMRVKTLWASNAPPLSNNISTNSVYNMICANYSNNDFNSLISCGSDAIIRYWDLSYSHKCYRIVDSKFRNSKNNINNNVSLNLTSTNSNQNNLSYVYKFIEGMQLIQELDLTNKVQTQSPMQTNISNLGSLLTNTYNSYNNWDPQDISPSHSDIITEISWLNNSNILVSGSKDGCIKLWK